MVALYFASSLAPKPKRSNKARCVKPSSYNLLLFLVVLAGCLNPNQRILEADRDLDDPDTDIPEAEFRTLIGPEKYRGHLNYFYGVIAEESLLLAVEEEIAKERWSRGLQHSEESLGMAHERLYGNTREALLKTFRHEMGRPDPASISITELKEFTYWLFKLRVNAADSSRVASDTKKGLDRLFRFGGT